MRPGEAGPCRYDLADGRRGAASDRPHPRHRARVRTCRGGASRSADGGSRRRRCARRAFRPFTRREPARWNRGGTALHARRVADPVSRGRRHLAPRHLAYGSRARPARPARRRADRAGRCGAHAFPAGRFLAHRPDDRRGPLGYRPRDPDPAFRSSPAAAEGRANGDRRVCFQRPDRDGPDPDARVRRRLRLGRPGRSRRRFHAESRPGSGHRRRRRIGAGAPALRSPPWPLARIPGCRHRCRRRRRVLRKRDPSAHPGISPRS